jgi:GT2 family glycosyltransferase/lipopolysaccharide/colanic/teichoic acid biosynthesis glycosyltransferase
MLPHPTPPDLAVVIVAFHSGADLQRCLHSTAREVAALGLTAEVVVVDNGGVDEVPAGVRLIRNPANRGFGRAVNQGFRGTTAPRVLLLNPDAALGEGALAPLLRALDDGRWGLVAPRLVLPDGRDQESPRRFYDLRTLLARRTVLGRLPNLAAHAARHTDADDRPGVRAVDWVTGAAMLLRRDAVAASGPFDERYFLYVEDLDLCRRLHAGGTPVGFVVESVVHHRFGGASRRQVPWNPLFLHHLRSGVLYALRWTEGGWAARAGLSFAGKLAGATLRAAVAAPMAMLMAPHLAPALAVLAAVSPGSSPAGVGKAPAPAVVRPLLGFSAPAVALALWQGRSPTGAELVVGGVVTLSLAVARRIGLGLRAALRRIGFGHQSALVVGDPVAAAHLTTLLADRGDEGLHVLGFLRRPADDAPRGLPDLGPASSLTKVARAHRADVLLLVGGAADLAGSLSLVVEARAVGLRCAQVLDGPDELLQGEEPHALAGQPLLPLGGGPLAPAEAACTALLGRLSAAVALAVLLPVLLVLTAVLSLWYRATPFVQVPRVGLGGRAFGMLRFRTGRGDAGEGEGALGACLRGLHIDELPQLLHVVRGEMALVGPRPVTPEVAAALEPWERARFLVPPGLTGHWQIDRLRRWRLEQMIASDLLYLLRSGARTDARILLETFSWWRR